MKVRPAFALILMLILIVAALSYGAYRGWSREYAAVQEMSESIDRMLASRVETANDILVVAARHLPAGDEDVSALKEDRDALTGDGTLADKASANARMTANAQKVLEKLRACDTVKNDKRDLMYAQSLLPQMLAESGELTAQNDYNRAARAYNERFDRNVFSARIARLLGIHRADEFSAAQ